MKEFISTNDKHFKLRFAIRDDIGLILSFIQSLAKYEELTHEVEASEEMLDEHLFKKKEAEVIIAEYDGNPVGFIVFFQKFSTFMGRSGIYLEDLFVIPEMRGKNLGRIMLSFLTKLAIERNCGRLEWMCLDWNEPSVNFYKRIGAKPMNGWSVFRLSDKELEDLANE